jgi:NAD+ kinase
VNPKHVVVVVKRSSYGTYVEDQKNTRVADLLASGDPTVRRMKSAHEDHEATVEEVTTALRERGAKVTVHMGSHSTIDAPGDLVITVGGDGTLLAASHQLGADAPLLGVNSSPDHSVGYFCAGKKGSVAETIDAAFNDELRRTALTRMRVCRNGEVLHNRVLNEALFCHNCPAATSRYILSLEGADGSVVQEEQKSSGLWIGPAAGSTAAQRSAGGRVLPLSSRRIQFVVREPYTPLGDRLRLRLGLVDEDARLVLRNKMQDARIFIDGHHIVFNATIGDVIEMRRSDEPLTVLGLERRAAQSVPPSVPPPPLPPSRPG